MMTIDDLPYLTRDIKGLGGVLKARPEDFSVVEVPLYEPCGSGTHVYFRVEKTGLSTHEAVFNIARALGRRARDIGVAGLKDAQAVTVQTLSMEHIDPDRIESVSVPRIRILDVSRHGNKLRRGHLKGNRFTIKVRETDTGRIDEAQAVLSKLEQIGVPNYFGPQRFGLRGDNWEVGRAVFRGDVSEAAATMAGRAGPLDSGRIREARELFDRGEYEQAAKEWPFAFRNERTLCRAMARTGGNAERSFRAVDKRARSFFLSAYQSFLFNQVVAGRIDGLNRLLPGDLAWRHPQGAVFRVEDLAAEQPRCNAFEISPTGPLFGHRMTEPGGEPGRIEAALLTSEGLTLEALRRRGDRSVRGGRRPLRFRPHDARVTAGEDDRGPFLEFSFFLEAGCYATTVLRELCKTNMAGVEEEAE